MTKENVKMTATQNKSTLKDRVQEFWGREVQFIIDTYDELQILLPSDKNDGASHAGEDGRYVESLIKETLQKVLPRNLEVLTGFIFNPAVNAGAGGFYRDCREDKHSTQLDIIVYDSANYPIYKRYEDAVIVPPEGVVAIISVKKTLHVQDLEKEVSALTSAAKVCHTINSQGVRGPFVALISIKSEKTNINKDVEAVLKKVYKEGEEYYDDLIGYIGVLNSWSIHKKRPDNKGMKGCEEAEYVYFKHEEPEVDRTKNRYWTGELHMGLQHILTGILGTYYDETRNVKKRPGFTVFTDGRYSDGQVACIKVKGLRANENMDTKDNEEKKVKKVSKQDPVI